MEDIKVAVQVTQHEQRYIVWKHLHLKDGHSWTKHEEMFLTIGKFDNMPVTLDIRIVKVSGHKVMFWNSPSQVVDGRMIDEWFRTKMPNTKRFTVNNFYNIFKVLEP